MPSSATFRLISTQPEATVRADHRDALLAARARAAPVLAKLLESIRSGSDADLDDAIPPACRELDLLFQAVGRVTQP